MTNEEWFENYEGPKFVKYFWNEDGEITAIDVCIGLNIKQGNNVYGIEIKRNGLDLEKLFTEVRVEYEFVTQ